MTLNEQHSRKDHILHIARGMMAAARTAPKAKGVDNLEIVTVTGDDLPRLAQKMRAMSEENGFKFFLRDANNVEQSDAVVVIGTRLGVFNLNCGMCGFPTCADKSQFESVPCAFNTNDLGIALGSAAGHAGGPTVCGPGNISGRSAPPPQGAGGGGRPPPRGPTTGPTAGSCLRPERPPAPWGWWRPTARPSSPSCSVAAERAPISTGRPTRAPNPESNLSLPASGKKIHPEFGCEANNSYFCSRNRPRTFCNPHRRAA